MEESKGKGTKSLIVLLVIAAVVALLQVFMMFIIPKLGASNTNKQEFAQISLSELEKKQDTEFIVPEFVRENKNLQANVLMGQFIEILGDNFVLKIGPFQDYDADPLALYETTEIDKKLSVSGCDIEFLRYRTGYNKLEHCTVINWAAKNRMYGMILGSEAELNMVLSTMGLTPEQTKPIESVEIAEQTEQKANQTQRFELFGKYTIELPKTENNIQILDDGVTAVFEMQEKFFMVVCQEGYKGFESSEETKLSDGYVVRFAPENNYDANGTAYRDYENVKSNIDLIVDSFKKVRS